jgi:hypothetical protein
MVGDSGTGSGNITRPAARQASARKKSARDHFEDFDDGEERPKRDAPFRMPPLRDVER